MSQIQSSKPLKNPWFWLVMAPLLFVVLVCTVLVTAAVFYGDDVVNDDYYKEGKLINHRFAAEHYAQQHGIQGKLTLLKNPQRLVLQLNIPRDLSEIVLLKLSHPVEANRDLSFTLNRHSPTEYGTAFEQFPEGRWYVRVEALAGAKQPLLWRISGEVNFSQDDSLALR